jgi:hypothetical protein
MGKALTGRCQSGAVALSVEAPARLALARPFDCWPGDPMELLQAAREYRQRN